MIKLYIAHNPFTVETEIFVNGEKPAKNSALSEFSNHRLQHWIDSLFERVYEICGGAKEYDLIFKGVPTDCLDVEEAVKIAREGGLIINLQTEVVEGGEQRLTKINQLIKDAEKNPLFKEYFSQSKEIKDNLDKAFDKDFDVFVVATMSSGKSTFINSMLGCDLLPALNEATTATIAKIYNDPCKSQGEFLVAKQLKGKKSSTKAEKIKITDNQSKQEASRLLSDWNKDPETFCIDIDGNIIGINQNENVRLVLTDTPGPNNSQDEEHKLTTMRYIKDSERSPIILYVLNATQLGINDDKGLLQEISTIMHKGGKQSRDRFLFILNKADVFDPEKGENVADVVERAKTYLRDNGITSPRIYPISAQFAALLRKRDLSPDMLTRSERGDLNKFEDLFIEEESMDLTSYMPLNSSEKKLLDDKNYPVALIRSGVPAVEVVISEYINKYNLPHRVSRAYEVLSEVISKSSNKAEIQSHLEQSEAELKKIKAVIDELEKKQSSADRAEAFINSLENESSLADETAILYNDRSAEILSQVNQMANNVMRDVYVDPHVATLEIDNIKGFVEAKINSFLIELEKVDEDAQVKVREYLTAQFQKYIAGLFEGLDIDKVNLPVFDGLRQQLEGFAAQSFVITNSDIQRKGRDVRRTKEVSDSSWWNPFSWGRTKTVSYTDTVYEDKVNLREAWAVRGEEIKVYINKTIQTAQKHTQKRADKTLKDFANNVNEKFEESFTQLTESLKENINNKEMRERTIAEGKDSLNKIHQFEQKLSDILKI